MCVSSVTETGYYSLARAVLAIVSIIRYHVLFL